jgi:hypothetical protein
MDETVGPFRCCFRVIGILTLSVRKGCTFYVTSTCFDAKRASSISGFDLCHVHLFEAQAVEQRGDGGAGVFAGGVEDAVGQRGGLELLLGFGAGVGFEVGIDRDEEAGGTDVDAGVLVVDGGEEELGRGEGDVDGLGAVLVGDADVFGFEPGEVDSGYRLAVDDEEDAVAGEEIGQDSARFGPFDDGIDRVDDGFEAVKALDSLDDGWYGGVKRGGSAGDCGGYTGHDAGGGMADEDGQRDGSEEEREQDGEESTGGGAAA